MQQTNRDTRIKKAFLNGATKVEVVEGSSVKANSAVQLQDAVSGTWAYGWYYSAECTGDIVQQDAFLTGTCVSKVIFSCAGRHALAFNSFFVHDN